MTATVEKQSVARVQVEFDVDYAHQVSSLYGSLENLRDSYTVMLRLAGDLEPDDTRLEIEAVRNRDSRVVIVARMDANIVNDFHTHAWKRLPYKVNFTEWLDGENKPFTPLIHNACAAPSKGMSGFEATLWAEKECCPTLSSSDQDTKQIPSRTKKVKCSVCTRLSAPKEIPGGGYEVPYYFQCEHCGTAQIRIHDFVFVDEHTIFDRDDAVRLDSNGGTTK